MKKLILIAAIAALVAGCNCDCQQRSDIVPNSTPARPLGKIANDIYSQVSVTTIDGCEYLIYHSSMTHKGDCTNSIHIYRKNK